MDGRADSVIPIYSLTLCLRRYKKGKERCCIRQLSTNLMKGSMGTVIIIKSLPVSMGTVIIIKSLPVSMGTVITFKSLPVRRV